MSARPGLFAELKRRNVVRVAAAYAVVAWLLIQAADIRIDVEGSAASVRVELDNWTGHRFTDFFTLVKIDGRWQIMSKVFYLHPE